jgi:hypothetical protein
VFHVRLGRGEDPLVDICDPLHSRLAERQSSALQQRQRADAVRVAQREVERDLAAGAAPDHDRRRRLERVDQRCCIVGVQMDVRGKRLGRSLRENPRRSYTMVRPRLPSSAAALLQSEAELRVPWMHKIGSPTPCSS